MNSLDLVGILDRLPERLEDVLKSTAGFQDRSPRLVRLLHELCPGASLCACLFVSGEESHLGAFDDEGNTPPEWIERLHSPMTLSHEARHASWLTLLNGAGHNAVVQSLSASGQSYGLAALRLTHAPDSDEARSATAILRAFARTLSLLFAVESLDRTSRQTREELLEQERLANAGALSGTVSHEFTNFLNLLLLQVSMLEYQLPKEFHADLAEIRRQGNGAAEVVREFQEYRRGHPPAPQLIDLNEVLAEAAGELTREPPTPLHPVVDSSETSLSPTGGINSLQLILAPDLPPVSGVRTEMQRLVRFLVSNAVRAAGERGDVSIRTRVKEKSVYLEVEDSGPSVSDEDLPYLFELGHPAREGVERLELATCRSLVRRLRGNLRAEKRPGSGVRIVVELPAEMG